MPTLLYLPTGSTYPFNLLLYSNDTTWSCSAHLLCLLPSTMAIYLSLPTNNTYLLRRLPLCPALIYSTALNSDVLYPLYAYHTPTLM